MQEGDDQVLFAKEAEILQCVQQNDADFFSLLWQVPCILLGGGTLCFQARWSENYERI